MTQDVAGEDVMHAFDYFKFEETSKGGKIIVRFFE